ncbi:MAG: hypothetical protein RL681_340 [Candidatus Parcubacteria bacterium]
MLWLLAGLNFAGLQAVGDTLAHFNDTEASVGNILKGSEVDFLAESQVALLRSAIQESHIEDGYTYHITVTSENKDGFRYVARAADLDGDLCDGLKLRASHDGAETYAGFLSEFLTDPIAYEGPTSWDFEVTRLSDGLYGICAFDLEFVGWQGGSPVPSGYTDLESLHEVVNYTEAGEDVQVSPLFAFARFGGAPPVGGEGDVLGVSDEEGAGEDASSTPTAVDAGQESAPPVDPDATSQGGGGGPAVNDAPQPEATESIDATSTLPDDPQTPTSTPTSTDPEAGISEPPADGATPPADNGTGQPLVDMAATMSEPKKEEPPVTPDVVDETTDQNANGGTDGNNAPPEPPPAPEPPPPPPAQESAPPLVIDIISPS